MFEFFRTFDPLAQALLAGVCTWLLTAAGASAILFVNAMNRRVMDGMLGFAGGVMIAASFSAMLVPAVRMSGGRGLPGWFAPAVGFVAGGIFLRLVDRLLPHLHDGVIYREGIQTSWRRATLFLMAMTLHNIPEGLAIGVAFGAAAQTGVIAGAIALAVGIGIQDMPEGLAAAMPLRREGMSRRRSFFFGQLSGIVEPFFAVLGAAAVFYSTALLPYALGFAGGAMIFVVVEQVVPESQRGGHSDIATMGTMAGVVLTVILESIFS